MVCEVPDHKHCLELIGKLSEYIDGELDADDRRLIEGHVEECVACFACLQTLRQTVALCGRVARRPLPESFADKMDALLLHVPAPPPP